MDENIKVAAGYLRQAANNMQRQMKDMRTAEYRIRHEKSQIENSINNELRQNGVDIAHNASDKTKSQQDIARKNLKIVKQNYQLRTNRNGLKGDLSEKIAAQEYKMRSLQSQITKLNSMASALDNWRSQG